MFKGILIYSDVALLLLLLLVVAEEGNQQIPLASAYGLTCIFLKLVVKFTGNVFFLTLHLKKN